MIENLTPNEKLDEEKNQNNAGNIGDAVTDLLYPDTPENNSEEIEMASMQDISAEIADAGDISGDMLDDVIDNFFDGMFD